MNWAELANGFAFVPLTAAFWGTVIRMLRGGGRLERFWEILPWCAGGALLAGVLPPQQPSYAIGGGIWFLVWLWHRTRTRRKRAAALIGAKTRALRDALVRKTREAAQKRPVLAPQPV